MAKKPTITTLSGSLQNQINQINTNFTAVRDAFDNTLSIDGSVPNAMQSDIDLNSNDLLNAKDIYLTGTLYLDGVPYITNSTPVDVTFDRNEYFLSGDNSTTVFTLPVAPSSASSIDIYITGLRQDSSTWSISTNQITFTEAPPSGTNNIEVVVQQEIPIGQTTSNLVTWTQEGAGTQERNVLDKLRDTASVSDFSSTQNALDTGRIIYFEPGTYTGSVTLPDGVSIEADATADLTGLTFTGSLRKGNRFTFSGDYEPTLGQLGHPAPNKGNSWQNALQVTRGTSTAPDTTALYARTAAYVEMNSAVALTAAQSSWSSQYLLPAFTVEHVAHAGTEASPTAGAFRAYSTAEPTNTGTGFNNLVGVCAIGQTNPGTGNDTFNVWGANLIAAQTSGNKPNNCVGIEVDVIHVSDHVVGGGAPPGPTTGNFTAYWAQSDAKGGVYSTAAFFASRTTSSGGWNWVLYSATRHKQWSVYLQNTEATTTTASGIYVETSAANATALRATTEGYNTTSGNGPNVLIARSQNSGVVQTNFAVTSNANNPVQVRVGGSLKVLQVGAADSAGTGFRTVRVTN